MKKEISPVAAAVAIVLFVLVAVVFIWKGGQKQVKLPDKPPSGPIELPASQQGRSMPGGPVSGQSLPGAPGGGH
jgi:hypothetical protein